MNEHRTTSPDVGTQLLVDLAMKLRWRYSAELHGEGEDETLIVEDGIVRVALGIPVTGSAPRAVFYDVPSYEVFGSIAEPDQAARRILARTRERLERRWRRELMEAHWEYKRHVPTSRREQCARCETPLPCESLRALVATMVLHDHIVDENGEDTAKNAKHTCQDWAYPYKLPG